MEEFALHSSCPLIQVYSVAAMTRWDTAVHDLLAGDQGNQLALTDQNVTEFGPTTMGSML